MNRIFDKTTKTELFLGKPAKVSYKDESGSTISVETNVLTPSMLSFLLTKGIVVMLPNHTEELSMDINFYKVKAGNKFNLTPTQSIAFIDTLAEYSPSTAFSLILKQIAFELDKKYSDHIRESEHIFTVSTLNGRISEVPKSAIRSYKNFAAFRTIEDAKVACRITRGMLKVMFADASK